MTGFTKATKKKSKLRMALAGVSGSGKTYSALMLAKGIGGRIAVIDSERGSSSLYSDQFDFDVLELGPPYSPERYIEAINMAERAGYDVLIIDSITHEWNGSGGILEIVDTIGKTKLKGNSYAAWNEGTPRHRKFVDVMLASPLHIIATIRTKAAYVETDRNGKKTYQKQGTAPEQRDGIEYEFTTVLDLSVDGNFATASKDRTKLFREPVVVSHDTGKLLVEWLNKGEEVAPCDSQNGKNEQQNGLTLTEETQNGNGNGNGGCGDLGEYEKTAFDKIIDGIDYFLGTNKQGNPFTTKQLTDWYTADDGKVVELKTYLTVDEMGKANRYFEQVRDAIKEKAGQQKPAQNNGKAPQEKSGPVEQQSMFPGSPNNLNYVAQDGDYF